MCFKSVHGNKVCIYFGHLLHQQSLEFTLLCFLLFVVFYFEHILFHHHQIVLSKSVINESGLHELHVQTDLD